jgi:hypothetical protein
MKRIILLTLPVLMLASCQTSLDPSTENFFVDENRVEIRGLEEHLVSAAYNVWTYTLTADGKMTPELLDDDDLGRFWQAWTEHHVVNAMHLITAKGVWTGEKQMHRKQHRRLERARRRMPPARWTPAI